MISILILPVSFYFLNMTMKNMKVMSIGWCCPGGFDRALEKSERAGIVLFSGLGNNEIYPSYLSVT